MNGSPGEAVKKAFLDALEGRDINTKGIMTTHNETITRAGAQQIWDLLKLADLKVVKAE